MSYREGGAGLRISWARKNRKLGNAASQDRTPTEPLLLKYRSQASGRGLIQLGFLGNMTNS